MVLFLWCFHAFLLATQQVDSFSSPYADLLAADQYAAQSRRAEVERELLHNSPDGLQELLEPDFKSKKKKSSKAKAGGGFGAGNPSKKWSKQKALASQQKERLLEDGVLRINAALSKETCQALRKHALSEIEKTAALHRESSIRVEDYYGIEPGRTCRTDLLLSMDAPSVSDALTELFRKDGPLRDLYESLVTKEGIFYELACVSTSKGSDRQCIHPDVPYQATAPLYVVFCALQDVTPDMGPTTFLRKSNTMRANQAFDEKGEQYDQLLSESQALQSCLQVGDLVVFDARVLHCGNANDKDTDRALFNFSFRNPQIKGDMGYKGSMRPGYTQQLLTLGNVFETIDNGHDGKGPATPQSIFSQFGNGLSN